MLFLLLETSEANIVYYRAKRMRKATGNNQLKSPSEIDSENHTTKDTLRVLARSFILTYTEPIVFYEYVRRLPVRRSLPVV